MTVAAYNETCQTPFRLLQKATLAPSGETAGRDVHEVTARKFLGHGPAHVLPMLAKFVVRGFRSVSEFKRGPVGSARLAR